mmetsp:Transcript_57749/g.118160  ORF Transcript_57749/g.118160 Transcript_57749/m.118160 type:complete len:209 (+) Transcript_57749:883-1509(+)
MLTPAVHNAQQRAVECEQGFPLACHVAPQLRGRLPGRRAQGGRGLLEENQGRQVPSHGSAPARSDRYGDARQGSEGGGAHGIGCHDAQDHDALRDRAKGASRVQGHQDARRPPGRGKEPPGPQLLDHDLQRHQACELPQGGRNIGLGARQLAVAATGRTHLVPPRSHPLHAHPSRPCRPRSSDPLCLIPRAFRRSQQLRPIRGDAGVL